MLTMQETYSAGDVAADFGFWYRHALQDHVYTAYRGCACEMVKSRESLDRYTKLQNMVGLTKIKKAVEWILADFQIRKLRQDAGLKTDGKSLHMLFTGNPGSAKTTCARLLAGILTERGLIYGGAFVECGRAELVGKYVGWTAKLVRDKFIRARGGILFIDEAYSLLSDDDFGPEAVNTIVREMENNRDSVIVIFAGYPEPMEKFLQSNEGLRSRIAFHLDFPDYSAEEMTEIFRLMLQEQGYLYEGSFLARARTLFSEAVGHADFGNGRFARNLLEQTLMKQSARLLRKGGEEACSPKSGPPDAALRRRNLITLIPEDLAAEAVRNYRQERRGIGFT